MSLRVWANTRLFFTSPRCNCKRRLNSLSRASLISFCASPSVISWTCLRRSLSFDTLCLPFCNKAGSHRQLVTGETNGLFRDLFTDAADLKEDTAWLDHGNPVVNRAFTATHTGFGRFGSDRLVREDANPYFTTTLHVAGHGNTCRFYLTRLHPAGFQGLQAELAESESIATGGLSSHAATVLAAIFCS